MEVVPQKYLIPWQLEILPEWQMEYHLQGQWLYVDSLFEAPELFAYRTPNLHISTIISQLLNTSSKLNYNRRCWHYSESLTLITIGIGTIKDLEVSLFNLCL
jgi:hypothetical protein